MVLIYIAIFCSSVHGFTDNSIDLTVLETATRQLITIALDIKGTSPFTITQYEFEFRCLGSSSDVNIRVPGES